MRPLRHSVMVSVGIAISVVAMWLAIRGIDWTQTYAAMRRADLRQFAVAFGFLVAGIFLRGERWRIVIPGHAPRLRVHRANAIGFFFNYVYPARAGDMLKVINLHRAIGQSLARLGASAIIDRLIDVLVLLAATAALFWIAPNVAPGKTLLLVGSTGLIIVVVLLFSPLGESLLRVACDYVERRGERPLATALLGYGGRLLVFRADMLAERRQWRLILATALVALADYLSVYFLFRTFGWQLPPLAPVAVWAIVSLGAVLPSAPAGIGVHQLACILGLGIFEIPAADAFAFSLALQVASFAAILITLLLGFGVRARRRTA